MSDSQKTDTQKPPAVLDGAEVKTLTRSGQRRKNRLETRTGKKDDGAAAEAGKGNALVRVYNFFVEAKEELGRVVWPTRKETVDSTWRLLILVIIAGLYLGLVDGILTRLLALIV
ncbi:MAG: preprotein translocase subunit SecE [Candidatus Adiutrix sp.]|jgi:preprotein translocase subunit SecE|nr:preprotein translocase subunit SecE [Candidatus Adiutrix sp.]